MTAVDEFLGLKRCQVVVPAPDGRSVVVGVDRVDEDGARFVTDLWRVPVDGGPPVQLTRGERSASAPAFRADGALCFLSKRPTGPKETDDEATPQVWALPAGGGEAFALTDEPLGVRAFRLRADTLLTLAPVLAGVEPEKQREVARDRAKNGPSARRFTRMPVRQWDHWHPAAETHVVVRRADGSGRRDLTPSAGREWQDTPLELSPDGRRALLVEERPGLDQLSDGLLVELDLQTGAKTVLDEAPRRGWGAAAWAPDGHTIAGHVGERSPDRAPTSEIRVLGGPAPVLPAGLWPTGLFWRGDGVLCVTGDLDGRAVVCTADGRVWLDGASYEGVVSQPGDPRVYGLRSSLTEPPEPFVADASGVRRLGPLSGAAPAALRVEELRVPGAGGDPVHGFLVLPAGPGPHPLLLWIHGGPIGAHHDGWHWRWNARLAAESGYAVLLPNPRGSTGYGVPFVEGIWGNRWGEACVEDLHAITDAACARPDVDAARTAAMGGSFGGYAVNWLGATSVRFRALVSHASVYDFATFQGTTDHPGWWRLQLGTTSWTDLAGLLRWSPSRKLPDWRTPTLVIHGERDFRCPVSEGLALFDALQLHGVESELLVFPDENHWILKPRNIRAWNEAWLDFVGRHLA